MQDKLYKGIIDEVTFQLGQKINATKALFSDIVINGDTANDILAFDGLDKALTGTSTELAPAIAIYLSTVVNVGTN